jgi:hypothetical protein
MSWQDRESASTDGVTDIADNQRLCRIKVGDLFVVLLVLRIAECDRSSYLILHVLWEIFNSAVHKCCSLTIVSFMSAFYSSTPPEGNSPVATSHQCGIRTLRCSLSQEIGHCSDATRIGTAAHKVTSYSRRVINALNSNVCIAKRVLQTICQRRSYNAPLHNAVRDVS